MKQAKDYLQLPYARIVVPVDQKSYHAEILEFPGCYAQGETPAEAYTNLEKAAESWIDTAVGQGQQIPEPSSNVTFSGNIALRLPRGIHRQAAILAERDKTSLNTFLISAISQRVGAEDFYNVMATRLEQRLTTTASNLAQAFLGAWQNYYIDSQTAATYRTTTKAALKFNDREAINAGRQAKLVGWER